MNLIEKFGEKNILITGGLGFIGSNLAIGLVKLGAKVVIVDSCLEGTGFNEFNVYEVEDKIKLIKGDMGKKEIVDGIVKEKDFIFNLAGQTGHRLSMENPRLDSEANCMSILNLLEACRRFNDKMVFVNASTRQLYGNQKKLPISEDAEKNFPDINAVHNITRENYFQIYDKVYGIKSCSLRLTNTYGPRQSLNENQGFIARFIKELITKNEIELPVDFIIKRDFNYVEDVASAFLMSAGNSGVYNLGGGEIVSIEDFAKIMTEINNAGIIRYKEGATNSISVNDSYLDTSKIKKVIGWEPKWSLRDGIKKTLEFFKKHKERYI